MKLALDLARVLEGKVRRKKNITGNIRYQTAREKARRICGSSAEVMVRITSFGKGAQNARKNLGYISRIDTDKKADLDLETDRGEILSGKEAIAEYAKGWEQDFGKPSKSRRDTMRMILSMPPGTDPDAVRNATRDFAKKVFGANHEYVFVLHTDEDHPHCHLTVKMLGYNGRKVSTNKEDVANWRDVFAQALRDQGISAEATRRAARGVVLKPDHPAVYHMKKSGRVSRNEVLAELDAIAILKAEHQGLTVTPGPWEAKIAAEQQAVRSTWLSIADQLGRDPVKPVFTPEGHQERLRRTQQAGATYQVAIAASRPDEPPRPVAPLRTMPITATIARRPAAGIDHLTSTPRLADMRQTVTSTANTHPQPVFTQEIDHGRTRRTQRDSAVYQSNLAAAQSGPPRSVASLRELPSLDVVRNRPAQVLLQPDARHRVGAGAGAGDGVRWSGAGSAGHPRGAGSESASQNRPQGGMEGRGEGNPARASSAGEEAGRPGNGRGAGCAARVLVGLKRLSDVPTANAGDKELASQIRAFVAAMPAVETRRDILKRKLAAQFQVAAAPASTVAPAQSTGQSTGQQKGAEPAAPSRNEISR